MKHWHLCDRWNKRGIACPFDSVEQHDPQSEGEGEPNVNLPTARAAPIVAPPPMRDPRGAVGVREPRKVAAPPSRADAAGVAGLWTVPRPPYAVDIPIVKDVGKPIAYPTREDWEVPDAPPTPIVDETLHEMRTSLGVIPERWRPSAADLGFLQRDVGVYQPRNAEAAMQSMAEHATAQAAYEDYRGEGYRQRVPLESEDQQQVDWLDMLQNPPAWLAGIPIFRAVQQLTHRMTEGGRVIPKFVPSVKAPPITPQPKPTNVPPRVHPDIMRPTRVPAVAGGGRHIDARLLLQGMIQRTRRNVRPFDYGRRGL